MKIKREGINMNLKKVAIIGRANVGKSTLFNRLVRRRMAIVDDYSGLTRDRLSGICNFEGYSFEVIDMAGWNLDKKGEFTDKIKFQIRKAIEDADLLLFMVDVKEGINPLDYEIKKEIVNYNKKIILVGNKADNKSAQENLWEFYNLGLGEPVLISSAHGIGVPVLLDKIIDTLKLEELPEDDIEEEPIKISIVGKPNVGKSTLLNALLGEERVIVDDTPGTTLDAIDVNIKMGERNFMLIDTAGIRKKSSIKTDVEFYSIKRTEDAILRSHVVLFVMDAERGISIPDKKIAYTIEEFKKARVIVFNKWDKRMEKSKKYYERLVEYELPLLKNSPIIYASALKKIGIKNILNEVSNVYKNYTKNIKTSEINKILQELITFYPPPLVGTKRLKIYYATQIGIKPPTFLFFVNRIDYVKLNYISYLKNNFIRIFDFYGSPVVLKFKERPRRKIG